MPEKQDILVVDDEPTIRRGCKALLEGAGYAVRTARDGSEALRKYAQRRPDLVLLDVMMPGMNGKTACAELRKADPLLPILLYTAKPSDVGAVDGLGFGADDYIDKAKSPEELLARIAAALRRQSAFRSASDELVVGEVTFDLAHQSYTGPGGPGVLTRREALLLRLLASDRGRIFSFDEILADQCGDGYSGDYHALHNAVNRLKAKLGRTGEMIVNVYGAGYKLLR